MAGNVTSPNDWTAYEGKIIPRNFNAGYVVLSYLVSYVGALTTLELIHRRTAMKGYYNWFLLAGSSISMGGIAIWCMHFIGNRAITLGSGTQALQISYNSGFTALSFFLPIIVLFLAFCAVGSNEKIRFPRVALGGTLAGFGIVGMHYLGQAGISNYDCIYAIPKVIGAGVIAVLASVGALTVFFLWRSSWETSWWRRGICAVGLAGAVSGMHWLASVGTRYRLRRIDPNVALTNNISRNATVIVVIVLSVGACSLLVTLTFLAQRRRSLSANRAQQVVLAAAVFDKDGRLMVSPEGLLPTRKITNSFVERSFDDIFGISHPVFLWIFRTTHNWKSIENLLPGMRNHIHHTGLKGSRPGTRAEVNLATDQGLPIEDYSLIFRELFCVAAADLAEDLNTPLENVGILFDEIISTGQKAPTKSKFKRETPDSSVDLERSGLTLPLLGRGQLLFLVSRATRREALDLQAVGFRFANTQNVLPILARSMQVNPEELSVHIDHMQEYAREQHIMEPGVHMACFAIRASVRGGFDILVRKDARNQLPTMRLPFDTLENWQTEYLKRLDSYNVTAVLKALKSTTASSTASTKEYVFATQLHTTLDALQSEIGDSFFNDALLVAKPIRAPCRGGSVEDQPSAAMLITFRLIAPIHSRAPGNKLEFLPLGFFRMQQHVYKNSPDHAVFARKTYREFAPVLNIAKERANSQDNSHGDLRPTRGRFLGTRSKRSSWHGSKAGDGTLPLQEPMPTVARDSLTQEKRHAKMRFWDRQSSNEKISSDTSSEKGLVDLNSPMAQTFGGIMVSQEVSVDVRETEVDTGNADRDAKGGPGMEMVEMPSPRNGVITRVVKEDSEGATFVDELFAICVESR